MLSELVAKPIPNTMASSTPKNLAVVRSSSLCKGVVPYSLTVEHSDGPYCKSADRAASAHGPVASANPK